MPLGKIRKLAGEELQNYALRLLSTRALTVAELKRKLRERAADATEVEPLVTRLKEYRALDDREYAEHYATNRAESGAQGRQRVLADLLRRKVAPRVAEKAVSEAYSGVDETAQVEAFLARKYRNQDLAALLQDRNKLASVYRRLRTAGFSSGTCIRVLRRHADSAGELEGFEDPST
jgi:regulatory protein